MILLASNSLIRSDKILLVSERSLFLTSCSLSFNLAASLSILKFSALKPSVVRGTFDFLTLVLVGLTIVVGTIGGDVEDGREFVLDV